MIGQVRYPIQLGSRHIHGQLRVVANWLRFVVVWLLFSPVALAFQSLPEREQQWNVVTKL